MLDLLDFARVGFVGFRRFEDHGFQINAVGMLNHLPMQATDRTPSARRLPRALFVQMVEVIPEAATRGVEVEVARRSFSEEAKVCGRPGGTCTHVPASAVKSLVPALSVSSPSGT
jgi:hypothetical protein